MKGRDLLSLADLSQSELLSVLQTAAELKAQTKQGQPHLRLAGQTLALVFEKPSLRTRLSFDVGMYQLGGHAVYLSPNEVGLGKRESVADVARVIGSMCNGIVARVFRHQDLVELAEYSPVPVINGLSDYEHPCQVLADLLTIQERFGKLAGLNLTYLGDGNNMAHSLIIGAALAGLNITVAAPSGYEPDEELVARARKLTNGAAKIRVINNPERAAEGADILYTDVWASMGQEEETAARRVIFRDYQLNTALVEKANSEAVVLHCLPAHRGDEITAEVMESQKSAVFQEAENRLHAQKALLVHLLG